MSLRHAVPLLCLSALVLPACQPLTQPLSLNPQQLGIARQGRVLIQLDPSLFKGLKTQALTLSNITSVKINVWNENPVPVASGTLDAGSGTLAMAIGPGQNYYVEAIGYNASGTVESGAELYGYFSLSGSQTLTVPITWARTPVGRTLKSLYRGGETAKAKALDTAGLQTLVTSDGQHGSLYSGENIAASVASDGTIASLPGNEKRPSVVNIQINGMLAADAGNLMISDPASSAAPISVIGTDDRYSFTIAAPTDEFKPEAEWRVKLHITHDGQSYNFQQTVKPLGNGNAQAVFHMPVACGDPTTISPFPSSPAPGSAMGVIDGDDIYLMNGYKSFSGANFSTENYRYNFTSNSWTAMAPYPGTANHDLAGGLINGKIYVTGGWLGGTATDATYAYDIATDSWSAPLAPLPKLLYGLAYGVYNSKLIVVGGSNGAGNSLAASNKTTYAYDPASNSWATLSDMPLHRNTAAFATIGSKLYVMGGFNESGSAAADSFVYDMATDSWSTLAPMPTARGYTRATVFGGKILVFGGYNGGFLDTTEEYDPATNTWTTKTPPCNFSARASSVAATYNGYVYLLTGFTGGNPDNVRYIPY